MITWGISANSHDAALSVHCNDKIEFASHTERFSGIKNDAHLNQNIIGFALQWGYPDKIVWYEKPFLKTTRQLYAGQRDLLNKNRVKKYLESFGLTAPISTVGHHHSHAAAGYYTSGFDHATVLVIDAIGEWNTLSVWEGEYDKLTCKRTWNYPNSIGIWYSAMTQRIGLKPNEEEYILMGMAAYGDAGKYGETILNDFWEQFPNHLNFFNRLPNFQLRHNLHRGCMWWEPTKIAFNIVDGKQEFTQWAYDVAAGTQWAYEHILTKISKAVARTYASSNLVFMGGCALNCSANSKIVEHWNGEGNIWIMPNPGDAGSCIGAVLAHRGTHIEWPGPYLGYDIEGEYPVDEIITELMQTGIAGVASGRAEFGPRSLGARSLLADPQRMDIKDKVNAIKRRQKFRPFAPAVLAEHASSLFEPPFGRYMQYTARCRYPERYPAIVHADGTSRVQTVTKQDHPGFRALLERWYELTGCLMLLNTSLNIKGKPIVNTLTDAQEFSKLYNVKVFS